jgi:hypothetical protein
LTLAAIVQIDNESDEYLPRPKRRHDSAVAVTELAAEEATEAAAAAAATAPKEPGSRVKLLRGETTTYCSRWAAARRPLDTGYPDGYACCWLCCHVARMVWTPDAFACSDAYVNMVPAAVSTHQACSEQTAVCMQVQMQEARSCITEPTWEHLILGQKQTPRLTTRPCHYHVVWLLTGHR